MLVTIPVVLISCALAIGAAASMAGAVEWGVIPIAATREGVKAAGFPDELGPLSEDYGIGIIVAPNGDQLGKYLAMLSQNFPEYEWMQGKVFKMKVAEIEPVFNHIKAIESNGHWANLARMLQLPPEQRAEYSETTQWFKNQLKVALVPLNDLLKSFPESRTGKLIEG